MVAPDKIMDEISKELLATLKAMGKAKTPEEKKIYSETVSNLSDSLGVFLNVIGDMMGYEDYEDYEDEDEKMPF